MYERGETVAVWSLGGSGSDGGVVLPGSNAHKLPGVVASLAAAKYWYARALVPRPIVAQANVGVSAATSAAASDANSAAATSASQLHVLRRRARAACRLAVLLDNEAGALDPVASSATAAALVFPTTTYGEAAARDAGAHQGFRVCDFEFVFLARSLARSFLVPSPNSLVSQPPPIV